MENRLILYLRTDCQRQNRLIGRAGANNCILEIISADSMQLYRGWISAPPSLI